MDTLRASFGDTLAALLAISFSPQVVVRSPKYRVKFHTRNSQYMMTIRSPVCIIISLEKSWSSSEFHNCCFFWCRNRCNRFAEGPCHSAFAASALPMPVIRISKLTKSSNYQASPQTHSTLSSFSTQKPRVCLFSCHSNGRYSSRRFPG
jgi:hypothetical protein